MENWNYASDVSKGVIVRRHLYNDQMEQGLDHPSYGVLGVTTDQITENNQRGFYRRWAELMQSQCNDHGARQRASNRKGAAE